MTKALLVVDVQRDFVEDGSLAVTGGHAVASAIAKYLEGCNHDEYATVLASADWHVDPRDNHFADAPDYVDSWPPHCVAGTKGAEFCPPITAEMFDAVFFKGFFEAAYSAFQGYAFEIGKITPIDRRMRYLCLANALKVYDVTTLEICGIATSHCVQASAMDAHDQGFHTVVLSKLCVGVTEEAHYEALADMSEYGIHIG